MQIIGIIESILFVASKPLSFGTIAKAVGRSEVEIAEAIVILKERYNIPQSGLHILLSEDTVQMATNATFSEYIETFTKDEIAGELTKAQLETLTIIAYLGHITRPEIEEIRGVNSSVILRNLLIRGLIEEKTYEDKILTAYTLSFEAFRHLGISSVEELPNYTTLHAHPHMQLSESEE